MTLATANTAPTQADPNGHVPSLIDAIETSVSGYLSTSDPEDIHQLRVAGRRLRAALKLTTHNPETAGALADETKWLIGAVASTRDADVLLETISRRISRRNAQFQENLKPLSQTLRNTANLLRGRAARSLKSVRYKTLIKNLRAYEIADDQGAVQSITIAPSIEKRQRKLHRLAKQSFRDNDPVALHETRGAAKKLRFSLEYANAQRGSSYVKQQIKALRRLQDTLGEAHDFHIAADRLSELGERNRGKWSQVTLSSVETLRHDLLRQADKRTMKAPRRYREFRGKQPRARLRKTLRKLEL